MESTDLESTWRKSSYSGNGGGSCVETASDSGVILVRDTKDRTIPALTFSADVWAGFTATVKGADKA
jgi:hypothetical protein